MTRGEATRPVRAALALALAAALAWPVVAHGVSGWAVTRDDPGLAAAVSPGHALARALEADARLERGDLPAATSDALAAIRASPLSAVALRVAAATRAADPAAVARLLSRGAALGWRDAPTQAWLLVAADAAGDMPGAAAHLDALGRTEGASPMFIALADALAATPAGRAALADRLVARPGWRSGYFGAPAPAAALANRQVLFLALRATAAPPTPAETAQMTSRLLASDDIAGAARAWRIVHPGAGIPADGRFARVPADPDGAGPFEWRLAPLPGGSAEAGGGAPPGLHVTTDGSASGPLAAQTVVLAPGPHRLAVAATFDGDQARDAFRWSVRCRATGEGAMLPPAPPGADRYVQAFTVPAGCAAETLSLEAMPTGATSASARFSAVAIR